MELTKYYEMCDDRQAYAFCQAGGPVDFIDIIDEVYNETKTQIVHELYEFISRLVDCATYYDPSMSDLQSLVDQTIIDESTRKLVLSLLEKDKG